MMFPSFEERHAAHIRPEMLALSKRAAPVTLAEYKELRANSYERHILNPRLDDEAFAHYAEHTIANSLRGDRSIPYATYDDALVGFVAPEMLRRWRESSSVLYTPPEAALRRSPLAAALVKAGASAQYAANQFEMALRDTNDAFARHIEQTAAPMRIVVEAAPGTLSITRAEAELFCEALDHLPDFAGEEQEAMLVKLRAFLDGVKS